MEWRGSGRRPRLLIGNWTWEAACGLVEMEGGAKWARGWADSLSAGSPGFCICPLWGLRVFIQGCRGIQWQGGHLVDRQCPRPSGLDSECASEWERRIMTSERTARAKAELKEVRHLRDPAVVLSG